MGSNTRGLECKTLETSLDARDLTPLDSARVWRLVPLRAGADASLRYPSSIAGPIDVRRTPGLLPGGGDLYRTAGGWQDDVDGTRRKIDGDSLGRNNGLPMPTIVRWHDRWSHVVTNADSERESVDADDARRAQAASDLVRQLYAELKALARARLSHEAAASTMQTTALVHEAYLRLVVHGDPGWDGRAHFFGAASDAMRRILVDRARARARIKRGGGNLRVELGDVADPARDSGVDVLALDEALTRLAEEDPRKARVVQLRYFAGLSLDEVAALTGTSVTTVKTDWNFARAWLRRAMSY